MSAPSFRTPATAPGPLRTGAQHNSADDVPHVVQGDPCDPSWCGKAARRAGMLEHVKRPIRPERDVDDRAEVALEHGRVEPGTMDAEKTEPRRGLSPLEPRVRLGAPPEGREACQEESIRSTVTERFGASSTRT